MDAASLPYPSPPTLGREADQITRAAQWWGKADGREWREREAEEEWGRFILPGFGGGLSMLHGTHLLPCLDSGGDL
jgi:hypothetical protein